MAPIAPPRELPVALKLAGGLSPERTIFIDGGVPKQTKWFDITLQCGPSLYEKDDIAFRLLIAFFDNYSAYMTNSSIDGKWDDERGRRYELRLKGLTNEPKAFKYDQFTSTSTDFLQSLRCSAAERRDSENVIGSQACENMKIKSHENTQIEAESAKISTSFSTLTDKTTMPVKSSHYLNTNSSRYIMKPVTEAIQLSISLKFEDKSRKKSSDKAVLRRKSSDHIETNKSKELRPTKSYESIKTSPKSIRLLEDVDMEETPIRTSNLSSHIDTSLSEIVNIYAPSALRIAESIFIRPDHESVRFSNKFELPKKTESGTPLIHLEENYSTEELNEIELARGEPFYLTVECLENGYLAFLNGDLFCVYPHHFHYDRVKYIVFNGKVDLEQVEIGGGNGPDRTLVVDLYDEVVWSDNVVVLTDETFADLVLASNEVWMVDAYTAWCPACNKLQPAWDMAAKILLGKVNLGGIDCDRNEQLTEDLNVQCFPTIYCFMGGKKSINNYTLYMGPYSVDSIVPWALRLLQYGKTNLPHFGPDDRKRVVKTLRKKRKPIMSTKGYLAGGYGYVLRKDGEFANQHETSSTKLIYISKFCQTKQQLINEVEKRKMEEKKKATSSPWSLSSQLSSNSANILFSRMGSFEERLQKATSSLSPNSPDLAGLTRDFQEFKTLVWQNT